MRITTVQESNSNDFDKKVNALMKLGWKLHGNPSVQTVAELNTWDGKSYSIAKTIFAQVMVIEK